MHRGVIGACDSTIVPDHPAAPRLGRFLEVLPARLAGHASARLAVVVLCAGAGGGAGTWRPARSRRASRPSPSTPAARPSLILPDLGQVQFLGMNGRTLLMAGLLVCVLGLLFGL